MTIIPLDSHVTDLEKAKFTTDEAGNIAVRVVGSGKRVVAAKTGDYPVVAGDSNKLFTNEGAAGSVNFTLPTAVAGLTYQFYIQAAQTFIVTAAAGDTIRNGGTTTTVAGEFTAATVGHLLKMTAINATEWIVEEIRGTWSVT